MQKDIKPVNKDFLMNSSKGKTKKKKNKDADKLNAGNGFLSNIKSSAINNTTIDYMHTGTMKVNPDVNRKNRKHSVKRGLGTQKTNAKSRPSLDNQSITEHNEEKSLDTQARLSFGASSSEKMKCIDLTTVDQFDSRERNIAEVAYSNKEKKKQKKVDNVERHKSCSSNDATYQKLKKKRKKRSKQNEKENNNLSMVCLSYM